MTANTLSLRQKQFVALSIVGKGSESAQSVPPVDFAGKSTYAEDGTPLTLTPVRNPPQTLIQLSNSGYSIAPAGAPELTYPAKVTLERDWIAVAEAREAIRPGMRVTAEIKTGERKVLDYLLSPVMQAVTEAGRER